ncbi:MAG: 2,3-bisphosphoglycerate-dependent phosphoglycerate mutase [Rhizobiales bacterium]|nr:2,3-bisphosphoglycerate-dependent phosphoglycerate mutase [Hyphomicrobiales bacterium]
MPNLVLIRHGQSSWNLENRFTGWWDVDVTDKGIAEARAAGVLMRDKGVDFDCCFTSLQSRAIKTLNLALEANPEFGPAKERMTLIGSGQPAVAAADPMSTGSIGVAGGELVVRKPSLPKAIEPPAELAENATLQTAAIYTNDPVLSPSAKKLITDRVPADENIALNQPPVPAEDAAPAEETGEKVVAALDPVAETEPQGEVTPEAEPEQPEASNEVVEAAPQVTGWTVQIASAVSEDAAWSTWKKIQRRSKTLAALKPVVMKADLGKKGIYYRVRLTGYEDKSDASACARSSRRMAFPAS